QFALGSAISEFWPVERCWGEATGQRLPQGQHSGCRGPRSGHECQKDTSDCSESANGSSQMDALSLESASKEAYFSRVETFTISFLMLSV
uniref:Uncharacterized protein n=1 Tax=Athene cunicularia TaxID=194338 RepID=A0A663M150_ATHCN